MSREKLAILTVMAIIIAVVTADFAMKLAHAITVENITVEQFRAQFDRLAQETGITPATPKVNDTPPP